MDGSSHSNHSVPAIEPIPNLITCTIVVKKFFLVGISLEGYTMIPLISEEEMLFENKMLFQFEMMF